MLSRSVRHTFGLVFAISLLVVAVTPAAAWTPIQPCNGNCGSYDLYDYDPPYGAKCKYETASYDLDYIDVNAPLMHGNYGSTDVKVRWLFRVFRQPSSGGSWTQVYQSSWQNSMADDNTNPAYTGSGFSRRKWTASENPTGRYKVRILMHWFNPMGNRVGIAAAELDHYRGLWSNQKDVRQDYCIQSW